MSKISDLLPDESKRELIKSHVKRGGVYCISMDESDGITPKPGDNSRNKFFIVLGFDSEGYAYGGVIFNSQINQHLAPDIKCFPMPIDYRKYDFLKHRCFVDCSRLKKSSLEKLKNGQYLGRMDDEDLSLIIGTIKSSPRESKKHLALYGL